MVVILLTSLFAAHSLDLLNILEGQRMQEIHILDQETQATILEVRYEEKSALLKGSILDYEGIYITYEFKVDNRLYQKTELIKKSDGSLDQILKEFAQKKKELNKMAIRYNSKNPRKSVIDISIAIASF